MYPVTKQPNSTARKIDFLGKLDYLKKKKNTLKHCVTVLLQNSEQVSMKRNIVVQKKFVKKDTCCQTKTKRKKLILYTNCYMKICVIR